MDRSLLLLSLPLFAGPAFSHPGHEERGLLLAFFDHFISDTPSLIAALLCIAAVVIAGLRKRKARK